MSMVIAEVLVTKVIAEVQSTGKVATVTTPVVLEVSGGGGAVTSVNGETGDVVLSAADVGALAEDAGAGGFLSGNFPNPGVNTEALQDAVGGMVGAGLAYDDGAGTLAVSFGTTAGTAAQGNDSRLSDARTPTAHAASHASAGSDPLTLSQSQVTNLTTDLAAKVPKSLVDAKGDLLVGTADDTPSRLAVGSDGYMLAANANATEGVAWVGAATLQYAASAQYHSPESIANPPTSTQAAAYAQYLGLWPCFTPRRVRIDGIATWCFTLESGSTMRFGLFACSDNNFTPGALIADYGTVSGASTGKKEATGSTYVGPGWFFLATWPSNNTTVRWMRGTSFTEDPFGSQIALGRFYFAWVSSSTQDYSAGLPSSVPALSLADTSSNPNVAIAQYRTT